MDGLGLNPSYIRFADATRKLKATWSMEAQQDLRAFHNIDAEQTLADIMAKEIQAEIDSEIIKDLAANSGNFYPSQYNNWPIQSPEVTPLEEPIKKKEKPKYRSIDDDWQGEL